LEHRPRFGQADSVDDRSEGAPARRFGIVGVAIRAAVALAIVAAGVVGAQRLVESRPDPVQRGGFERSFTVSVTEPVREDVTTTVRSYGEVVAGTQLDLRTSVGGEITEVAGSLRPGGAVSQGDVLARIDTYDYELALENARNDLADARLTLTEAEEQKASLEANVAFAEEQLAVAQSDLERAEALVERGSLTDQELEARELTVSQRRQTVQQARSDLQLQDATIARNRAAIERAQRAVDQAERTLESTTIRAPFDGVVVSSSAVLGASIGANEAVATLYDANDLEVRFTLPERDYGRLSSMGLIGRDIRASWNIDPAPVELTGEVTRVGARIDPSLGGVEVYAALDDAADTLIRPGTFVSVVLDGVTYEDAYRLPETALYENEHFYVVDEGRMQSVDARVRARDGGFVVVDAQMPEGARVVTTRLAQAGDGVRVEVEGEQAERAGRSGGPGGGQPGGG